MRIEPFTYLRPATWQEACAALAKHAGRTCILAGGTDLLPRLKQQVARPAYVIDMTDVAKYSYVHSDASGLCIGAGTTLQTIAAAENVQKQAPALVEAASKVASQQIRNVGTVGGNLCQETRCWYYNQSLSWKRAKPPCYKAGGEICHVVNKPSQCYAAFQGDTAPALLALDAQVKIISTHGERIIPLELLYSGKSESPLTLAPDEMVAEIRVPAPAAGSGASYMKFSHRRAVDFPLAAVAVWLKKDSGNGRIAEARLAISGVGSAPIRVSKAEEALTGQEMTVEVIAAAADAAVKAARPVNNLHHGQPALRRQMVGILSRLAIEEAEKNARG